MGSKPPGPGTRSQQHVRACPGPGVTLNRTCYSHMSPFLEKNEKYFLHHFFQKIGAVQVVGQRSLHRTLNVAQCTCMLPIHSTQPSVSDIPWEWVCICLFVCVCVCARSKYLPGWFDDLILICSSWLASNWGRGTALGQATAHKLHKHRDLASVFITWTSKSQSGVF